jgi:branched-chain amino acid transport system ATP-binding protein
MPENRTPEPAGAAESGAQRLLHVDKVEAAYGQVQVLWGVTLNVARGQVVSIIGPNGAGKTTLLNTILGVLKVKSGRIEMNGKDITAQAPHVRVQNHMVLVPEGRQLWPKMTVEENVMMGAFPPSFRKEAHGTLARVYDMFPRLKERRNQLAGTLSGGEQQMCAIGRGLMAHPQLLMLDEPSLGLAPKVVKEIFELIENISSQGVTILLVAQNVTYALEVSDYVYLMDTGRVVLEGPSHEVRANRHVQDAYLGSS